MNPYLPLLFAFLGFALLTGLVFFVLWVAWIAPRRIRSALGRRLSPLAIRSEVKFSLAYWLVTLLISTVLAGIVAWLCWKYLGYWLYESADDWRDRLATLLNRTLWVVQLPVANLEYVRIIPMGIVVCALLGAYVGALFAAWAGIKLASKRFLMTRAMF